MSYNIPIAILLFALAIVLMIAFGILDWLIDLFFHIFYGWRKDSEDDLDDHHHK